MEETCNRNEIRPRTWFLLFAGVFLGRLFHPESDEKVVQEGNIGINYDVHDRGGGVDEDTLQSSNLFGRGLIRCAPLRLKRQEFLRELPFHGRPSFSFDRPENIPFPLINTANKSGLIEHGHAPASLFRKTSRYPSRLRN